MWGGGGIGSGGNLGAQCRGKEVVHFLEEVVDGGEGGHNDDDLDSDGLNANHSSDEEEEEYAVASALDRDAPLDASLKKVLRRTEEEIEELRAI